MQLDDADKTVTANFALFFSIHLAYFFGLKINDNFDLSHPYLDLQEGCFVSERPVHPHFLENEPAYITSQLLKTLQPEELNELKLNQAIRRQLLFSYHDYYVLHIQDFGKMKTLDILHEVLSA
jgi:DNA repair protein RecO (recombination protein O)